MLGGYAFIVSWLRTKLAQHLHDERLAPISKPSNPSRIQAGHVEEIIPIETPLFEARPQKLLGCSQLSPLWIFTSSQCPCFREASLIKWPQTWLSLDFGSARRTTTDDLPAQWCSQTRFLSQSAEIGADLDRVDLKCTFGIIRVCLKMYISSRMPHGGQDGKP